MRIAVSYDGGNIFQHLGKTHEFKIYNVEGYAIESTEFIENKGSGHRAIVKLLKDQNVDVLICGGLGDEARKGLEDNGIQIFSGITGNADEAVAQYLTGELVSQGGDCDHHHEHGHGGCCGKSDSEAAGDDGCGCDGEEPCCSSGGCGGCGGGCGGGYVPPFDGPNVGKHVKVHYRGTLDDGTQFDSSYDRGEPLDYTCGVGQMIVGFDAAVAGMDVGEKREVHIVPALAYGDYDEEAIIDFPLEQMPDAKGLQVGDRVYLSNPWGQQFPVTVAAIDDEKVSFDANHELAGKNLNFEIELVSAE